MVRALIPETKSPYERRPAVFLDKDGTLVVDVPFNVNPSLIELAPASLRGLRSLQRDGFRLVVISNQSGLALNYFTKEELEESLSFLHQLLLQHDIALDGIYYCPHAQACGCRKPSPGLFFNAAEDLNIELSSSWMIGDILHDIEAGHRAGCRSVLIDNGNETEWDLSPPYRVPYTKVVSIDDAADRILENGSNQTKEYHS